MDDTAYLLHRDLIIRLAYDITGSWTDAEDVTQSVYLAWRGVSGPVENPRAYLARMATNRALDALAARERVRYLGPYLPEPVLTGPGADEAVAVAEEVEIALMVVLGSLSPLERAAFLLHDVFSFSHLEIAEMLQRNPAAVRQLASRARRQLASRRPTRQVAPEELVGMAARFVAATQNGDLAALCSYLTDSATLIPDGGGKVKAPLRPLVGPDKIARFLIAVGKDLAGDVHFEPVVANHRLGFALWLGGELDQVMWLLFDGERVDQIILVRNPDKLAHLAASGKPSGAP